MRKVGAYFTITAFFLSFTSLPAAASGLRIGPFHFGLPTFGHRHHYHRRPLHRHGSPEEVTRQQPRQENTQDKVEWAMLYPGRALPAIFQNIFWSTFSSPWPFGYETIFTTAFAKARVGPGADQCRQSVDANAMMERLRAELQPSADQMERLQRLGDSIRAAVGYLAETCSDEIPNQPIARLRLMESEVELLRLAIDIIRQPLQDFEQSLTPEQRARFRGEAAPKIAGVSCGASSAAVDWSIDQIEKSVRPTEQQRAALGDVHQVFREAASDLRAHCPTSPPQSAVARFETVEGRLDATSRAILSIRVALDVFESKLSDDQKNRLGTMTFAVQ
jgi:Spy/CpxP family protein refolding chaperone